MTELCGKPTNEDYVHVLHDHAHSAQNIYPTGAAPVQLTSGVGAWALGTITEIVPASTITSDFDIHWMDISNPDTNGDYEIELYYGAGDTFAARVAFTRTGVFTGSITKPVTTILIPANSRIRAKMQDGSGESTAKVKIYYHTY